MSKLSFAKPHLCTQNGRESVHKRSLAKGRAEAQPRLGKRGFAKLQLCTHKDPKTVHKRSFAEG